MKESQTHLKREIGVFGLSTNIVNIMIGAGIFVLPAIVAAGLGSASIIAYLFCGFLITLVMLCFAEVGTKITTSGGSYAYIEGAFGKYPGFLTALLFMLSSITADGAVANAIADIIGSLFPILATTYFKIPFFLVLFSGLAYVNIVGLKSGVGIVKSITILKIIPLLIIVAIGFKDVEITNLYWTEIPSLKQIGEVSIILFFAFQGAETGLSISGEIKNPKKTIPAALRLGIVSVLLIYVLIQSVSLGVLGDSLSTFKENPLAEVAHRIFGPVGFMLITIGAAVSMFGNLSSEILSVPRVLFGAANDNVIPIKQLAAVHKKYATPFVAIIIYAALGMFLAMAGGFKELAIISSASTLLIYLGVSLATIKLRTTKSNDLVEDSFKIPGGYLIPIASCGAILWFLSNLSMHEFKSLAVYVLAFTVLYGLINFKKKYKPTEDAH